MYAAQAASDLLSLCAVVVSVQQDCVAVASEQTWHLWALEQHFVAGYQYYVMIANIIAAWPPVLWLLAMLSLSVKIAVWP